MRVIIVLIFLALSFAAVSSHAEDDQAQRDFWRKEFTEKRSELIDARDHLEEAKAARRKQRREDYPHGKAKHAIEKAMQDAQVQFEDEKRAYLLLFERAKKEGALPGWYRDFEEELPTLLEVEEVDPEAHFPEESSAAEEPVAPLTDIEQPPPDELSESSRLPLDEQAPDDQDESGVEQGEAGENEPRESDEETP